jgi:hypothetical protein
MRKPGWLFLFLIILSFTEGCISAKRLTQKNFNLSAEDAKSEIRLLHEILQANHPSLYWYTTKDSVDRSFENAISNIKDSVSEWQLKKTIAGIISTIRCGHTSVRYSKRFTQLLSLNTEPQFPLSIKTWNDTMVIIGNRFSRDTVLKRGTLITSVNGMRNRQLLDSMFSILSTDGYADNFKSQLISFNFASSYRNTFPITKNFNITYLDSAGNERSVVYPAFQIKRDTTRRIVVRPQRPETITRKQFKELQLLSKRSLTIDSNNTAVMRLNTFSNARLRIFFHDSFKELKKKNIGNLIIDLRENGGGSIGASAVLSRYIRSSKFKLADTVAAISRSFHYGEYIRPSFIYWLSMHFTARKHKDGRYHFGYLERHAYKPKKNNHFDGNVYVIQGGYTFSASTMFVDVVKDEKKVLITGEETGGGSYGNSAVHLPVITLPKSKIRITLPLYRLVFDHNKPKTGHGIFPELYIPPSVKAIREGYDVKLRTISELIKQNQHASTSSSTLN